MSEESASERNHALLIIERDDLDDQALYQVTKVDHGPDSKQYKIYREAHEKLLEEVNEERDARYRLVEEWYEDESWCQNRYEYHQDRQKVVA